MFDAPDSGLASPERARKRAFRTALLGSIALPAVLSLLVVAGGTAGTEATGLVLWMIISAAVPIGFVGLGIGALVIGKRDTGSGMMLGGIVGGIAAFVICLLGLAQAGS